MFWNSFICSIVLPGNCSSTCSIHTAPSASFNKYLLSTLISLAVNLSADLILMILSFSSTNVPLQPTSILRDWKKLRCNLLTLPLLNCIKDLSILNLWQMSLKTLKRLMSSCLDHLHLLDFESILLDILARE